MNDDDQSNPFQTKSLYKTFAVCLSVTGAGSIYSRLDITFSALFPLSNSTDLQGQILITEVS